MHTSKMIYDETATIATQYDAIADWTLLRETMFVV